jgi:hypothetical protein
MSRLRWPDLTNSPSEIPGTIQAIDPDRLFILVKAIAALDGAAIFYLVKIDYQRPSTTTTV